MRSFATPDLRKPPNKGGGSRFGGIRGNFPHLALQSPIANVFTRCAIRG